MSTDTARREAARRLWRYVKPQRGGLALAVLAFVLASATEPLIPKLLQVALDKGFATGATFPLWMVPVALIGLFVLRGVLSFIGTYMLSRGTSRAVLDLRRDLAASLLRTDASVFNRMSPGVAVAKVINDPQVMSAQLSGAALTVLRDGTTSLALLLYLFYENWQLTTLSLAVVPLLSWGVRVVHKRIRQVSASVYDAQNRLVAIVDDLARSWRVIRTFDAGQFEGERFGASAQQVQRNSVKAAAAAALMTPMSQSIASVGVAIIVTMALYQGRAGDASVGAFAAYIAALLLLVSRVRHLTDVSQPIVNALVVAAGCFELLDAPAEPDEGRHEAARAQGDIALDDLRIVYPGSELPALAGATMHVQPGTTVGLVGTSGAGKSTVVNALLGFAVPNGGSIKLDGVDIGAWRKTALRRQFAVVSQDIVLFDSSVAANVAYAAPRDDGRIEQCLRAAALWDAVMAMPGGLEAPIGVNGSRLSGGQRQRLAIARAMYKDAPIWIFDEATSALDSDSERAVQQALEAWHGQRTMIVIAHRLSTIRRADAIHVFDSGRVVESGTHESLMALGGRYARAVNLQQDGAATPEL